MAHKGYSRNADRYTTVTTVTPTPMSNQHPNVTAFVAQYTASMSKEQSRAFWKKFRKAANAYAQTQAERITKLEQENKELRTQLP